MTARRGSVDAALAPPTRLDLLLYRLARDTLVVLARLYCRTTYHGREHVPTAGPFVLACSHRSNVDFAVISGIARRRLRYMGKESLWNSRLLGGLISALGAFPVHRGTADREAMRRCLAILANGEPLVVFPEGTRRKGPAIEDLHDGAAYIAMRARVPLVPVAIGGSERVMARGQHLPRPVKLAVVVGPALMPPATEEGQRPPRRAVRELTAQLTVELQKLFDEAEARAAGNRSDGDR